MVVSSEKSLLESRGHRVRLVEWDNHAITGKFQKARVALEAVYSRNARAKVQQEIRDFSPDVAHIHNFFPLISPAIYFACFERQIPVVQTLHNYRLLCPSATLFRSGRVCEDCVGKTIPWPSVLHGCYRDSRIGSLSVASMLGMHNALGTFTHKVAHYIALSRFSRDRFIAGGLPADKISIKPNFLGFDPGIGFHNGEFALFVGRLTEGKGIKTLLVAIRELQSKIPLVIAGDGPLWEFVKTQTGHQTFSQVKLLGRISRDHVFSLMKDATFLIAPNCWYETFNLTIAEAFATALPVIATKIGAQSEIVEDGRNGILCAPGDSSGLARGIEWAWDHPAEMSAMGRNGRSDYEGRYRPERNYEMLMSIYQAAMAHKGSNGASAE